MVSEESFATIFPLLYHLTGKDLPRIVGSVLYGRTPWSQHFLALRLWLCCSSPTSGSFFHSAGNATFTFLLLHKWKKWLRISNWWFFSFTFNSFRVSICPFLCGQLGLHLWTWLLPVHKKGNTQSLFELLLRKLGKTSITINLWTNWAQSLNYSGP